MENTKLVNEVENLLENEVIEENGNLILLEEDFFNQEAVKIVKSILTEINSGNSRIFEMETSDYINSL